MIIRRCVPETEQCRIMEKCHASPYGGHFAGDKIARKILQSGLYWPTLFKDYFEWVKHCDACQRMGNLSRRNKMPLQGIPVVQIFNVCGIDFMGPFPSSFGNMYILLAVDKDQNIGKHGYIGNWILRKYRKISVDILTKISVMEKLTKIL